MLVKGANGISVFYWRRSTISRHINTHSYLLLCPQKTTGFNNLYVAHPQWQFNSLGPGRSECASKNLIFNLVLLLSIFRSSHDNALRWMPQDLTDDQSTSVQVMAWCRQAASHYLNQCRLRSLPPYGVTTPRWVHICLIPPRGNLYGVIAYRHPNLIYKWNVVFV